MSFRCVFEAVLNTFLLLCLLMLDHLVDNLIFMLKFSLEETNSLLKHFHVFFAFLNIILILPQQGRVVVMTFLYGVKRLLQLTCFELKLPFG